MNYSAHYDRLILRARSRILVGYRECHHVIPRCMGGTNSAANIVRLTPEEHYVAHQLLVKMHPGSRKLAHAPMLLSKRCTGNKAFGWLRRRLALSKRGVPRSSQTKAKLSLAHRGKSLSLEHRAKISASHRGRIFTPETRAKIAAALRGMKRPPMSAEQRAKIANTLRGVPKSPNHREKTATALRGKKLSLEHRAKLIGNKNGRGNRGVRRTLSKEHRTKLSVALHAYYARKSSSGLQVRMDS